MVWRFVAAYFWVGRRGSASPAPDQATGMAVPDESESSRFVTDHATSQLDLSPMRIFTVQRCA